MKLLGTLRKRFLPALQSLTDDPEPLLELVRPAQDARFGDYQANLAMPLGKRLGRPPREVAEKISAALQIDDLCQPPEVAGPGFINLRLRDSWMATTLQQMADDARLLVSQIAEPRTYVLDYSSPNVAKPMHVGHIRSTVIGAALDRTLRFVGHKVISDNHLGDWGTQFGMIIYGFKNFVDDGHFAQDPVGELGRLYKLVHQLVQYHGAVRELPELQQRQAAAQAELDELEAQSTAGPDKKDKKEKKDKSFKRRVKRLRQTLEELQTKQRSLGQLIANVEGDPTLASAARDHDAIETAVLAETARLHAGDPENLNLWKRFLPECLREIEKIYDRIGVKFDQQLGESFYQNQLASVVDEFQQRGLSRQSDGAECVFLPGFETPMIIRKQDGAFLYATTDLATIKYRIERWNPDAILYVVDHRQHEHFEKLFAAARQWLDDGVELRHVSFGTVLGEDGRPYRTRSGDVVGLEGLLDEAIRRAYEVVCANDDGKPNGAELDEGQRRAIARTVGHAAIKYADLSHNRTSDYVFSYDKMVAMEGNTATYMQYSYARTQSIFARGNVPVAQLRQDDIVLQLDTDIERQLALELLRFEDAIWEMLADFRPNVLTNYLFSLASHFSKFYQQCDVLRAEPETLRTSRLALCDMTGRTLRQGMALLGIDVVDKM